VGGAADDEELELAAGQLPLYAGSVLEAELFGEKELYEREPGLRAGLAGGMLVRGDAIVFAPAAAREFARGLKMRRGRVAHVGDGSVMLEDGERLVADAVICAAGAEIGEWFPELGVRRRKGHIVVTEPPERVPRHQMIELSYLKSAHGTAAESVAFNVQPRLSGELYVGSSRQYAPDGAVLSGEVEPRVEGMMWERACAYLPWLRDLEVRRRWVGFRAASADGLPLIGAAPGMRRTFVASGHEGLGITTSLATAELLRALLEGMEPPIPLEPYDPARGK
jgi:glycine/D-amino acid oxidase-like deaminating enzyme